MQRQGVRLTSDSKRLRKPLRWNFSENREYKFEVPHFSVELAAGTLGQWNFFQLRETITKHQQFDLVLQKGTPDVEKIKEFFRITTKRKGESLLSQFGEPVQLGPGHWFFPNKEYSADNLPMYSDGPHAGYRDPPDW